MKGHAFTVERAGHSYSFLYSLLGSRGWVLLSLCCRSHQVSTKRQKGSCLYITSSPFKTFKIHLTNSSTYYVTCLTLLSSSKKKTKVPNDERRFCLPWDIILTLCWLLQVSSNKNQILAFILCSTQLEGSWTNSIFYKGKNGYVCHTVGERLWFRFGFCRTWASGVMICLWKCRPVRTVNRWN